MKKKSSESLFENEYNFKFNREYKRRQVLKQRVIIEKQEFSIPEVKKLFPKINNENLELVQLNLTGRKNPETITLKNLEVLANIFKYKICTKKNINTLKKYRRPPVVTIMGHVDHGKTSLLDCYRNSNRVSGEAGGITQKVGGFMVNSKFGDITFIDTPGHEIFTGMRKRGAECTDLVIQVISAVEGVQPQTIEVLNILNDTKLPFIIAINKIDLENANPESVEEKLFDMGIDIDIMGGDIPVVHISCKEKTNLDQLQELIIFESERIGVKDCVTGPAECVALECKNESKNDTKLCSLVIRSGEQKTGDWIVAGDNYGKVMTMANDRGQYIKQVTAGSAVEISGLNKLPNAGESIFVVKNEKTAEQISKIRKNINMTKTTKSEVKTNMVVGNKITWESGKEKRMFFSGNKDVIEKKKVDMENSIESGEYSRISRRRQTVTKKIDNAEDWAKSHKLHSEVYYSNDPNMKKIIIKAQDYGSIEAMQAQITKIMDNSGSQHFCVLKYDIGAISETDQIEAMEFDAQIYCMDVIPTPEIKAMACEEGIEIKCYDIIYRLFEDLRMYNEEQGEEIKKQEDSVHVKGTAKVKQIFDINLNSSNTLKIAGFELINGYFNKKQTFRVKRDGDVTFDNLRVQSLKKFTKEVKEVKNGEGGISFKNNSILRKGDIIECYKAF